MKTAIQILDEMIHNTRWCTSSDKIRNNILIEAKERIQKETWWISVEDMLPNKFDNVILLCEHSVEKPTRKKYEIWFRDDEYFYAKSQERLIFWKVTHWMPLPLPTHE